VRLPCLEYAMRFANADLTGVRDGASARDGRRARARGWDAATFLAHLERGGG